MPLTESTLVANPHAIAHGVLTRRNFFRLAAGSAGGLALYAGEVSRHELDTVYRTVSIPRLPDSFAGFKVVQISDFHFGEYDESLFLKDIVRRVNAAAPDLVVLTGDFVSSNPMPVRFSVAMGHHCAEILGHLQCPLRYAVLGNHDVLVGAAAITDALKLHGFPLLANRSVPLERDGQRLWIAGIEDALEQHPDLSAALPANRLVGKEPLLLLAHEPDFADDATGHDIALTLSGHTHGGQVRIPFLPPLLLPEMGRRYLEGHYRLQDGMQLYVNRGIGAVNLPFRFRCPAEITVLTLQPESHSTKV